MCRRICQELYWTTVYSWQYICLIPCTCLKGFKIFNCLFSADQCELALPQSHLLAEACVLASLLQCGCSVCDCAVGAGRLFEHLLLHGSTYLCGSHSEGKCSWAHGHHITDLTLCGTVSGGGPCHCPLWRGHRCLRAQFLCLKSDPFELDSLIPRSLFRDRLS